MSSNVKSVYVLRCNVPIKRLVIEPNYNLPAIVHKYSVVNRVMTVVTR